MNQRNRLSFLALTLALSVLLSPGNSQAEDIIIWSDLTLQRMNRSDADGSNVSIFRNIGSDSVLGMDADVPNRKLYWAENGSTIKRADFDGSNVEDVITGLSDPRDVALDLVNNKIYWTDSGTDKISRANLDGSNVEDIITAADGINVVLSIVVDPAGGKLYWGEWGDNNIQRSNLDGSNIEILVNDGNSTNPRGLAIHSDKLYWVADGGTVLYRSELNGTSVTSLFTALNDPHDVSIAADGSKIYWTERDAIRISRGDLDGTNKETINSSPGNNIHAIQHIALVPEIDIQGNSVSISSGDTTPSAADHTDFGSVDISSGNFVRTFTIRNTDFGELAISGTPRVAISGTHSADFSVTSQPAATIAANSNSTFQVEFDPSATGVRTATLTIANDDADEATYTFNIQGTGTTPEINLVGNSTSIASGDTTPTTADHTDFGSVNTTSDTLVRTFTIENTGTSQLTLLGSPIVAVSGTNAADFTVTTQPTSPIGTASSDTFQVTFDPSGTGARSATLTILNGDTDESTYTFAIQGTGIQQEINVVGNGTSIASGETSPAANNHTDFGSTNTSSSSITRTFTIENTGSDQLSLTGSPRVSISGTHASDFSISSQPSSPIAASGSDTFQVTFDPSSTGTRSATVSISNDDSDESTYTFSIQGTGIQQEIDVTGNSSSISSGDSSPSTSDHTDFGSVSTASGTIIRTFTVRNTGSDQLTLTSSPTVSISGSNSSDFTVSAQADSPIAASASETFQVTFDPSSNGTRSATVNITSNDSDESTYTFSIQGTGTAPEVDVSGNSTAIANGDTSPNTSDNTDFGSLDTASSSSLTKTFAIQNNGTEALLLSGSSPVSLSDTSVFSVVTQPSTSIGVGATSTFEVRFTPSTTATSSATVSFTSNDADEATYSFLIQATAINSTDSDGDGTPDTSDTDDDNDGVSDEQEEVDGTDPLDEGSTLPVLPTSFCTEWNGFLGGLLNILELINLSSEDRTAISTIKSISGEDQSSVTSPIGAGGQADVLVHDMEGYTLNSYGQICVSVSNGNAGDVDGRMVYYKPSVSETAVNDFQFAFAIPYSAGLAGNQFLPFNTFQPSLDPADASNLVANWIQLTNLSDAERTGTLVFYAQNGDELESLSITIGSGVRQDFPAHQFGTNLVGTIKWVPQSADAKFLLRNVRYYYDNVGSNNSFDSAFQLEGTKGSGAELIAPVDTRIGTAVLEVGNALGTSVTVPVVVYDASGTQVFSENISLEANGSQHIVLDSVLSSSLGVAVVDGPSSGAVFATVMQYVRTDSLGIQSIYGVQARQALGSVLRGAYNSFLEQDCKLLISNNASNEQTVSVRAVRSSDSGEVIPSTELSVPAKGVVEYSLCENVETNQYGVVTVQPSITNSIVSQIIRIGPNESYRFPTLVRQ